MKKKALELLRKQKSKVVVETVGSDAAGKEDEGEDADTEEVSEGLKEKALVQLKEKCEGKRKAVDGKKRKQVVKSTPVVESEGSSEDRLGPSKKAKVRAPAEPVEGEEELSGSGKWFLLVGFLC